MGRSRVKRWTLIVVLVLLVVRTAGLLFVVAQDRGLLGGPVIRSIDVDVGALGRNAGVDILGFEVGGRGLKVPKNRWMVLRVWAELLAPGKKPVVLKAGGLGYGDPDKGTNGWNGRFFLTLFQEPLFANDSDRFVGKFLVYVEGAPYSRTFIRVPIPFRGWMHHYPRVDETLVLGKEYPLAYVGQQHATQVPWRVPSYPVEDIPDNEKDQVHTIVFKAKVYLKD